MHRPTLPNPLPLKIPNPLFCGPEAINDLFWVVRSLVSLKAQGKRCSVLTESFKKKKGLSKTKHWKDVSSWRGRAIQRSVFRTWHPHTTHRIWLSPLRIEGPLPLSALWRLGTEILFRCCCFNPRPCAWDNLTERIHTDIRSRVIRGDLLAYSTSLMPAMLKGEASWGIA